MRLARDSGSQWDIWGRALGSHQPPILGKKAKIKEKRKKKGQQGWLYSPLLSVNSRSGSAIDSITGNYVNRENCRAVQRTRDIVFLGCIFDTVVLNYQAS